jgi:hypothetical protein
LAFRLDLVKDGGFLQWVGLDEFNFFPVTKLTIQQQMLWDSFNFVDFVQSQTYTIEKPVFFKCGGIGSELNDKFIIVFVKFVDMDSSVHF